MSLSYDDIRDLLPAYALGAVDETERAVIEDALESDAELRAELESFNELVGLMGTAVPQVTPPPNLGSRIMEAVNVPTPSDTIPFDNRWRYYALAAAAVMLAFLGITGLFSVLNDDIDEPEPDPIAEILNNEDATTVQLVAAEGHEEVDGAFIIAPDHQQAVLQINNLALLSPEQSYQLWLVREDERLSGLVFRPDSTTPKLLVNLPNNFGSYRAIGVTIEPDGGSEGPTGDAVFTAVLPQ